MTKRLLSCLLCALILSAPSALAQGETVPPGPEGEGEAKTGKPLDPRQQQAVEVLKKYLDAVKAKRWAQARKLTHPKTLEAISARKKRLGSEDHPMAPWFYEKSTAYLKDYRIKDAQSAPLETVVVETREDQYQVEEKGLVEDEMATYLVGQKDGSWYVVDKKRQTRFTDASVKLGYKGYFDPAPAREASGPAD